MGQADAVRSRRHRRTDGFHGTGLLPDQTQQNLVWTNYDLHENVAGKLS